MPVIISMLRGINVGASNRIRMDALRDVYASAGMQLVQTFIQSGNIVFKTNARDLGALANRLEDAFEAHFHFRSATVLRTLADMKQVVAENPFAGRQDVEPSKLLVVFPRSDLSGQAREAVERVRGTDEEICLSTREIYMYFPAGMGRSKLFGSVDKTVGVPVTARNWNTVTKLVEMGSALL